jgi:hypothetical protein
MRRFITVGLMAAGLMVAATVPSIAAGNKAVISLTCGGGATYEITIAGNGNWQTARDNDSTLVFHPTAFGESTHTFYPADGSDPQVETDTAHEFQAQAQAHNGQPTVECTYHAEFVFPEGTEVDQGPVSGYTTGTPKNA